MRPRGLVVATKPNFGSDEAEPESLQQFLMKLASKPRAGREEHEYKASGFRSSTSPQEVG